MNELFNVKGKVVVITGGAGILGKGIAAYLAKEGAKVVVLDRSEEAGKALVESIKAEGNEAKFLYTDVMDKEVLEGNKVDSKCYCCKLLHHGTFGIDKQKLNILQLFVRSIVISTKPIKNRPNE